MKRSSPDDSQRELAYVRRLVVGSHASEDDQRWVAARLAEADDEGTGTLWASGALLVFVTTMLLNLGYVGYTVAVLAQSLVALASAPHLLKLLSTRTRVAGLSPRRIRDFLPLPLLLLQGATVLTGLGALAATNIASSQRFAGWTLAYLMLVTAAVVAVNIKLQVAAVRSPLPRRSDSELVRRGFLISIITTEASRRLITIGLFALCFALLGALDRDDPHPALVTVGMVSLVGAFTMWLLPLRTLRRALWRFTRTLEIPA